MFDTLLKRLIGEPTPDPLDVSDSRLAMAALMVRVARADYDYAQVEIATINQLLGDKYNLEPAEIEDLRTQAEELETLAPDTIRFTRAIKEAVPYEDRNAVVQSLWKVVLSDNKRDQHEDSFLRMVSKLLGVNDRDSAIARQKAQKS